MLTRIDFDDPGTVETLQACADAVTELNRAQTVAMVEPFISRRVEGKVVNDLSPAAVVQVDPHHPGPRGEPAPTRG